MEVDPIPLQQSAGNHVNSDQVLPHNSHREGDESNWPQCLTACDGTFTLSTFVVEIRTAVTFMEALRVFHDRLSLRLVMGTRREIPDNSVVTTHATEN